MITKCVSWKKRELSKASMYTIKAELEEETDMAGVAKDRRESFKKIGYELWD